jgi:sulfur carrier protein
MRACVAAGCQLVKPDLGRYPKSVRITVNGEQREFPDGLRLDGLIDALGLAGKRLAVEHNREIARREAWGDIVVADGDTVEIVHFVGGG